MVTAVTEAAAATVGCTVAFAVEEGAVESAVWTLATQTAAEASPALRSSVAGVVFVAALVADVATAVETVAVLAPAAEFGLGTLEVVVAVVSPAVSVVPVVQTALSAVAVVPRVLAAVMQAVAVVAVVAVVGLAWTPERVSAAAPSQVDLPLKRSLQQQEEGNERRLKTVLLWSHMTSE